MREVDKCAFRSKVRVGDLATATGNIQFDETASCGFCAEGISSGYRLQRFACIQCCQHDALPNPVVLSFREGLLASRVCEPHIPHGDDKVYRISVDAAAGRMTDKAKLWLAKEGYDPVYGARPLRRAIERYVENPLSTKILRGEFSEGDTILVDLGPDGLTFTKKVAAKVAA